MTRHHADQPQDDPRWSLPPSLMDCRRLFLRDYEVHINIGVHAFEKTGEQRVLINVELYIPLALSTPSHDQLDEVVDYDFIRRTIAERVARSSPAGNAVRRRAQAHAGAPAGARRACPPRSRMSTPIAPRSGSRCSASSPIAKTRRSCHEPAARPPEGRHAPPGGTARQREGCSIERSMANARTRPRTRPTSCPSGCTARSARPSPTST